MLCVCVAALYYKEQFYFFCCIIFLELFMSGAALTVPLCFLTKQVQHGRQLSDFSHAAAQNFPHLQWYFGKRRVPSPCHVVLGAFCSELATTGHAGFSFLECQHSL